MRSSSLAESSCLSLSIANGNFIYCCDMRCQKFFLVFERYVNFSVPSFPSVTATASWCYNIYNAQKDDISFACSKLVFEYGGKFIIILKEVKRMFQSLF